MPEEAKKKKEEKPKPVKRVRINAQGEQEIFYAPIKKKSKDAEVLPKIPKQRYRRTANGNLEAF